MNSDNTIKYKRLPNYTHDETHFIREHQKDIIETLKKENIKLDNKEAITLELAKKYHAYFSVSNISNSVNEWKEDQEKAKAILSVMIKKVVKLIDKQITKHEGDSEYYPFSLINDYWHLVWVERYGAKLQ